MWSDAERPWTRSTAATPPEFMLHTGDITHLSKPEEFDTVDQLEVRREGRVLRAEVTRRAQR
jgi:hypothetical protein